MAMSIATAWAHQIGSKRVGRHKSQTCTNGRSKSIGNWKVFAEWHSLSSVQVEKREVIHDKAQLQMSSNVRTVGDRVLAFGIKLPLSGQSDWPRIGILKLFQPYPYSSGQSPLTETHVDDYKCWWSMLDITAIVWKHAQCGECLTNSITTPVFIHTPRFLSGSNRLPEAPACFSESQPGFRTMFLAPSSFVAHRLNQLLGPTHNIVRNAMPLPRGVFCSKLGWLGGTWSAMLTQIVSHHNTAILIAPRKAFNAS